MLRAAAPVRAHALLVAMMASLFAMLALAVQAWAAGEPEAPSGPPAAGAVPYAAMDEGGLFLPADRPGYVVPAATVETHVEIDVHGMIARARITQRYVNPTDDWTEGVYVFPLPENAAVDRLRLIVGERIVEGEIAEREAAQAMYEEARDAGQQASLVSQQRPNIFTNAVANIAPNDAITVQIEYQQTLTYDQGAFRLRFPMVVLPRYIPGGALDRPPQGTGWSFDTDRVPDASRITPPVAAPGSGPINPVSLTVRLDPGFVPASIDSPYHSVSIAAGEAGKYRIALDGEVWADRDFELVWRPAPSEAPTAGVFSESWQGGDYHLLMVMPPEMEAAALPDRPREVVFVIDSSGSMAGDSIVQAREALLFGLDGLGPQDRFNVIAFDDRPTALFRSPRPADPGNLAAGQRFVESLVADNGTEMRPALEMALDGERESGRIRQVVFVTDGAVGNEAELFAVIHERLGDARLFTVGIGSAPNSHFMREAAEAGRGTFTYIGAADEVAERMGALFARLEHPALTDISVDWPVAEAGGEGAGSAAEMYPAIVPDLYLGEPVVATVRLPAGSTGAVTVSGLFAGEEWSVSADLSGGRQAAGVAGLWARDRIAELERRRYRGADPEGIRAEILEVALRHEIVSEYTSLVAIDDAVVRPADEPLETEAIATNPPHGVEMDMVMGPAPADAGAAPPREASLQAIRQMAATGSPVSLAQLPRGATPAQLNLLIGLATLLAALALLLAARRLGNRPAA